MRLLKCYLPSRVSNRIRCDESFLFAAKNFPAMSVTTGGKVHDCKIYSLLWISRTTSHAAALFVSLLAFLYCLHSRIFAEESTGAGTRLDMPLEDVATVKVQKDFV